MLWLLKEMDAAGKVTDQFWQTGNHPEIRYRLPFLWQKLKYIHNNPVRAGLVYRAEEYVYSSAADYVFHKQVGRVKVAFLDGVQTTYCAQHHIEHRVNRVLRSHGVAKPISSLSKLSQLFAL
jgi:hypothetical protein